MIISILIIVVSTSLLFYFFKKNKKPNDTTDVFEDDSISSELTSDIYNSEDDLECYDENDKAILKKIGVLIQKLPNSWTNLTSTSKELKKNADNENIIIPYPKINILFNTDYVLFEELGFEDSFLLSEFSTTKSGFTEFEILNEICKFYRQHDKDDDLQHEIIEIIEVFKSNDDKITIAFITGS